MRGLGIVLIVFGIVGIASCSRSKKCTTSEESVSNKDSVVVIHHQGQNQEYEDSMKREKNKLKK